MLVIQGSIIDLQIIPNCNDVQWMAIRASTSLSTTVLNLTHTCKMQLEKHVSLQTTAMLKVTHKSVCMVPVFFTLFAGLCPVPANVLLK